MLKSLSSSLSKKIIFLGIIIGLNFLLNQAYAQTNNYTVWSKSFGGTDSDVASSVSYDANGNVYISGTFMGTTDFDPGTGVYNLTSTYWNNCFVVKLDSTGNFLWAKQFGGQAGGSGNIHLKVDPSGNVYVGGDFIADQDFDPGAGVFKLYSDNGDIFLLKLDSSGNFVWVKQFQGIGSNFTEGMDIGLDPNNSYVYLGSEFFGTGDFDPGVGTFNLTAVNNSVDIFILKLDTDGNFVWAKQMGGPDNASGTGDSFESLDIDNSGNILVGGHYTGVADFDPSAAVFNLTSAGMEDAFIAKLNSSGDFLWAKRIGGTTTDICYDLATDALGNVYSTGYYTNSVDFDPGPGNYNLTATGPSNYNETYILKLDPSGNFVWVKTFQGANDDEGESIDLDALGNIYVCGSYSYTVDFDPGPGIRSYTSSTYSTSYLCRLDPQGNFGWATSIGIQDYYYNKKEIAVDNFNNVFVTGRLYNPNNNLIDVYIGKFAICKNIPNAPISTTPIPNLGICAGITTTLSATGSYSLNWYSTSTGGTSLATGTTFTTPAIYSKTTYYVADNNVQCGTFSPRIPIEIVPDTSAKILSTTNGSRCDSGSVTLKATGYGTINWYSTSSGGASLYQGTDFLTPKIPITSLDNNKLNYYVEASSATCTSPRKIVFANAYEAPAIISTTANSRCGTGKVVLNIKTSNNCFFNWHYSPGGPSLGGETVSKIGGLWSDNFTSPDISTTTTFYVTAANGYCWSPSIPVIATVNPLPVITSTLSGSGCSGNSVTLEAYADRGTINWFDIPTGGTSIGTGTSYVTPNSSTLNNYYVSATDEFGCTSGRIAIRTSQVGIDTITSNSVCDYGKVTLKVTSSSGNINWYDVPSGGTSLGTGLNYTTPDLSTSTTYFVEASNGTCTSERKAIDATVVNTPKILSSTPGSSCGQGAATLSATVDVGTIKWYTASTAGSLITTGTTYSVYLINSQTFYVEAVNGNCVTPVRTPVAGTVITPPAITSTTPATVCDSGTVDLKATSNSGILEWYASNAFGSPVIGTGNSFTTPKLFSSTTYYVSAKSGSCSSSKVAVDAVINYQHSSIWSINSGSICLPGTVTLSAGATNSGTVKWYNVPTGGTPLQTGNSYTTPTISTTTIYYAEANLNGCVSPRTAITATVINPVVTTTPAAKCGSGSVALKATTSIGTLNWYSASTGGSSLGTGTTYNTPTITSTKTYYVSATSGSCTSARIPVVATINTMPIIPTARDGSTCNFGTVLLAVSQATTINWYSTATGGVSLGTNISYRTPALSTTTTYYADVSDGACVVPRIPVVATVKYPTVITSQPVSQAACMGSNAQFNVTADGSGPFTYQWFKSPSSVPLTNGGDILGANTPTLTVSNISTSSAGNYYSKITSPSPCAAVQSSDAVLSISNNDVPSVSLTNDNSTICEGQEVIFNASGSGTGTAPNYTFYNATNDTPLINGIQNNVGPGQSEYSTTSLTSQTCVYAKMTSSSSCITGPSTVQSNTLCITALPLPTVTINTSNPNANVCFGDKITLTGSGAVNYSWSDGIADGVAFSPSSTKNYTVTGTDVNGCSNTASQLVTVNSLPTVSISGPTTLCEGMSSTLTADGASTYVWSTGGQLSSELVSPTRDTTYIVTGNDYNGCSNTASHNIKVNPLPIISISGELRICAGNSTMLTASGATTYIWSTGGEFESEKVSPTTNTTYSVTGKDDKECENIRDVEIIVDICNGILDELSTQICTSPNPTTGEFEVKSIENIEYLTLTDMFGKVVMEENPRSNLAHMNINELGHGVYFLKITSKGKSSIVKIVKE